MASGHPADPLDCATQAFVDAVKEAAAVNFVSQKGVASILRVGQSTVSNWFNNYTPPNQGRLHRSNELSVNKRLYALEVVGMATGKGNGGSIGVIIGVIVLVAALVFVAMRLFGRNKGTRP